MKKLIISVNKYEKKMILLIDNIVSDILIERETEEEVVGNFYKGKIDNVIESMGSLFVDIGFEKKAFLNINKFKNKEKFNIGEEILVQVEKNPRGNKGASLTLDYSISSKNLVLLPNSKRIMISSKIENKDEIERLRNIFLDFKDYGLIIRTSAQNIEEQEILEEYKNLILKWEKINLNYKKVKVKKLVYSSNEFIFKIFKEYFFEDISELIIDNEEFYNKIIHYVEENKLKECKLKIKKYLKDEDILEYYSINTEINKALNKKVFLDSGAYLIIEKTEALVSIDVNSGANVSQKNIEDTILATNIEAVSEIFRQIKLRNLAGIIIIDFINMKKISNQKKLLKILEETFRNDRVKVELAKNSPFGLIEMTRQRKGKELDYFYKETCKYCYGTGSVFSNERVVLELLKELINISKEKDIKKIIVETKKDIIDLIKKEHLEGIKEILLMKDKEIEFKEINMNKLKENKNYSINLYK